MLRLKKDSKENYIDTLKSKLLDNPNIYTGYDDPRRNKRELEFKEYITYISKRKIIPAKTIALFYDDPKTFFSTCKTLLSENCLFDINLTHKPS